MDKEKLDKVECRVCKWSLPIEDFNKTKSGSRQSMCRYCFSDKISRGHDYTKATKN